MADAVNGRNNKRKPAVLLDERDLSTEGESNEDNSQNNRKGTHLQCASAFRIFRGDGARR
jgi:hypothetical protein